MTHPTEASPLTGLLAALGSAMERAETIDSPPIAPVKEAFGAGNYMVHLPKPAAGEWRCPIYRVEVVRNDDQPFAATLQTTPLESDDEVVFLRIPPGTDARYRIEVLDASAVPWRRVFQGPLASIPDLADPQADE